VAAFLMTGSNRSLLSRTQYHFIRSILRICDVTLPEWGTLRELVKKLKVKLGLEIRERTSPCGNPLFGLDIKTIISNVSTLYPHGCNGIISLTRNIFEGVGQPFSQPTFNLCTRTHHQWPNQPVVTVPKVARRLSPQPPCSNDIIRLLPLLHLRASPASNRATCSADFFLSTRWASYGKMSTGDSYTRSTSPRRSESHHTWRSCF
jgi:hypothetical protein